MSFSSTSTIARSSVDLDVSDGSSLPAYVARPVAEGNYPGILVLQEAFGVNAHIRDIADRFAQEGYVAIAPALFHRTAPSFEGSYTDFAAVAPHMSALTDDGQLSDLQAAFSWLTSPTGGKVAEVASIGFCMGGRSSFLANANLPLFAAASYYGGGIAPSESARFPQLLDRTAELHAPMLFLWGGKDKHIGPQQIRAVEDSLSSAGKDYINVVFSRADHGFFCDARASYDPISAAEAWPLTLSFLSSHSKVKSFAAQI